MPAYLVLGLMVLIARSTAALGDANRRCWPAILRYAGIALGVIVLAAARLPGASACCSCWHRSPHFWWRWRPRRLAAAIGAAQRGRTSASRPAISASASITTADSDGRVEAGRSRRRLAELPRRADRAARRTARQRPRRGGVLEGGPRPRHRAGGRTASAEPSAGPCAPGAMTARGGYEVLGLEPGAGEAASARRTAA